MKWANKKWNDFNICNVSFSFFFKKKKNTFRYYHQNLSDMIYSSWDIEHDIMKLVILDHFLPFYSPKNTKNQNLKNEKICCRYHHFAQVYLKFTILWCTVPVIRSETDRIFCHFRPFFILLPTPLKILKIIILKKNEKI